MNIFETWANKHIAQLPLNVKAINFNLYEMADGTFDAQIIGCDSYDTDDDDWACESVYSSEEDVYSFTSDDWEAALDDFLSVLNTYFMNEDSIPTHVEYISVGFVDGDLNMVYKK